MRIGLRFGDRFKALGEWGGWLSSEFESLITTLQAWSAVEHNDDGTHSAITASSITVTDLTVTGIVGPINLGGTHTYDSIVLSGEQLDLDFFDESDWPAFSVTADVITPVMVSSRSFVPDVDAQDSLGYLSTLSAGRRWRNGYFSHHLDCKTLNANAGIYGSGVGLTAIPAGQLTGTITSGVQDNITRTGTVTSGTWSASFGAVSGANLTNLTAANLTGTIPAATLSGRSLADLGTRSAGDLSSGNLAYARMPSGSGTWSATPSISGAVTLSSTCDIGGAVTIGSNLSVSGSYLQSTGVYMYPGSFSGYGAFQTSAYLASHSTYGLYTNASYAAAGGVFVDSTTGYSFTGDTDTKFYNDGANSTAVYCGGTNVLQIANAGYIGIIPYTDNAKQCGINGFAWQNVYAYNYPAPSSISIKRDIIDTPLGVDFLMQLRPRAFKYLADGDTAPVRHGFVLEEVVQVIARQDFGGIVLSKEGVPEGFDRGELIAPLVNAFQQHELRLKALEGK